MVITNVRGLLNTFVSLQVKYARTKIRKWGKTEKFRTKRHNVMRLCSTIDHIQMKIGYQRAVANTHCYLSLVSASATRPLTAAISDDPSGAAPYLEASID